MKFSKKHYILAKAFNALVTADLTELFEENLHRKKYEYPLFHPQMLLFSMFDRALFDNDTLSIQDIFSELSASPLSCTDDTRKKIHTVMLALSELAVRYAGADEYNELYIEDLFFQSSISDWFSFIQMLSGICSEGHIERILSFTEDANELLVGPYTDICDLKIGDVLLKTSYAYKTGALAEDIIYDEEQLENITALRKAADDIMIKLLLIPYEVCYTDHNQKFQNVLIEDNNQFVAAVTNN